MTNVQPTQYPNNPPTSTPMLQQNFSLDMVTGLLVMLAAITNCTCRVCKILRQVAIKQVEAIAKQLEEEG